MTIQIEKFSAFNKERKSSLSAISSDVSKLNKNMMLALKQQAYMRSNPDNNGASDLIPKVASQIDSIAAELAEVNKRASHLLAVKAGTMTIDQILAEYPAINLTEYSDELL